MFRTRMKDEEIQSDDFKSLKEKLLENILPMIATFILCYLSSQAKIFGQFAPFGVAFAASFGGVGLLGSIPFLGTIAGYFFGGTANLKYIFAVLLIAILKNTILKRFKNAKLEIISASVAVVSIAAASVFTLVPYGFLIYDIVVLVAESLICMSFAYFFGVAQPIIKENSLRAGGLSQKELAGIVLSLSVFLLALQGFILFDLSLARILAVFVVLIAAYYGGMAHGSMAGVLTGLTMSLGSPIFSFIIGAYAFGGLLAGIFSNAGRFGSALAFIAANSIITIYFNGSSETLIGLYEILIAGAFFIMLPKNIIKDLAGYMLLREESKQTFQSEKLRRLFVSRLKNAAKTFRDISKTLDTHIDTTINEENEGMEGLTNKIADKICKNCRLSMYCWGNSFNDTTNVFKSLRDVFKNKGKIESEDFPGYFLARCIKKEKLINEFNINYMDLVARTSGDKTAQANRKVLAVQYNGISNIIGNMAEEFGDSVIFDAKAEDRVKSYLTSLGAKKVKVMCYVDSEGIMNIEGSAFGIKKCPNSLRIKERMSTFTGRKLEIIDINFDDSLLNFKLTEKECYSVTSVKVFKNKEGEKCCGDTSSVFRTVAGKYVISISDGMGSGKVAASNSSLTIKLLEKLIKAGFDKESACKLINSAMILKSNDETFVTVDLAVINLINGIAEFVKAGAAPSFIKRGNKVYELGCSSLPAGILSDAQPDKAKCQLKEGDMLIMVSDGVSSLGTQIITQKCANFAGESPAELADALLAEAEKINIGNKDDDMTIAVALLKSAS